MFFYPHTPESPFPNPKEKNNNTNNSLRPSFQDAWPHVDRMLPASGGKAAHLCLLGCRFRSTGTVWLQRHVCPSSSGGARTWLPPPTTSIVNPIVSQTHHCTRSPGWQPNTSLPNLRAIGGEGALREHTMRNPSWKRRRQHRQSPTLQPRHLTAAQSHHRDHNRLQHTRLCSEFKNMPILQKLPRNSWGCHQICKLELRAPASCNFREFDDAYLKLTRFQLKSGRIESFAFESWSKVQKISEVSKGE